MFDENITDKDAVFNGGFNKATDLEGQLLRSGRK